MKATTWIVAGAITLAFALPAAAQTAAAKPETPQQTRMKACAAEWDTMKKANQTAGKQYRDFQKECLARTTAAPAAAPPAAQAKPAATQAKPAPAAKPAAAKPDAGPAGKPGREAMLARERACAADWKAAKAANKVPAGQKWPQYWSECNKRKKEQGM